MLLNHFKPALWSSTLTSTIGLTPPLCFLPPTIDQVGERHPLVCDKPCVL